MRMLNFAKRNFKEIIRYVLYGKVAKKVAFFFCEIYHQKMRQYS